MSGELRSTWSEGLRAIVLVGGRGGDSHIVLMVNRGVGHMRSCYGFLIACTQGAGVDYSYWVEIMIIPHCELHTSVNLESMLPLGASRATKITALDF